MSERSCTRSKTTARPFGEMSKSRISKSPGSLVNCRSAPVSASMSQRSLCSILPLRKASPFPPTMNLRCRASRQNSQTRKRMRDTLGRHGFH